MSDDVLLREQAARYKKDLEEGVLRFWLQHAVDKEHG